jgi:hypothetical protein
MSLVVPTYHKFRQFLVLLLITKIAQQLKTVDLRSQLVAAAKTNFKTKRSKTKQKKKEAKMKVGKRENTIDCCVFVIEGVYLLSSISFLFFF